MFPDSIVKIPVNNRTVTVKIPISDKTNVARNGDTSRRFTNVPPADKKWLRTFVFLICLSGLLYQTSTFLEIYFQYPTVVDVEVIHREKMNIPSITVCNKNRYRRSVFCKAYPEYCVRYSNEKDYCSEYPYMCENSSAIYVPLSHIVDDNMTCNHTELMELGHPAHPLIQKVTILFSDENSTDLDGGDVTYIALSEGITCPRNCYVLNSAVGKLKFELINVSLQSEERKIMKLFLDLQPEEYFALHQTPEALLSVHSPYEILNPYIRGIALQAGRIYYVNINEEGRMLLKNPYRTRCVDYFSEWTKLGYPGPYTWEMCVHYCKMNRSVTNCNCVSRRVVYPSDSRYCTEEDELCIRKLHLERCYKECRPECHSQNFQLKVSHKRIPEDLLRSYTYIFPGEKKNSLRKRAVILIFSVESPAYVVHKYSPQYQAIEVFSFVGGYIGIWLGISLFASFDLIIPAFTWLHTKSEKLLHRKKARTVWVRTRKNLRSMSSYKPQKVKPVYVGNRLPIKV